MWKKAHKNLLFTRKTRVQLNQNTHSGKQRKLMKWPVTFNEVISTEAISAEAGKTCAMKQK